MSSMFYNCSGLTDLDVSSLDTSKVTDMSYMFYECRGLTGLDLSNFDTSNVTNMAGMFSVCSGLTGLDVSSLDTSKVTDMAGMFSVCSGLTGLDVSSLDTSKVTDMGGMFSGCSGLTYLDLSNFDTSNVTDMGRMFSGCSSLTGLDLSNFDTSKVTDMAEMFYECSSLTYLDLSNFDTSNVTDMSSMFYNCSGLTDLDVSSLDTSKVTDMAWIFRGCYALTDLDLSAFDLSSLDINHFPIQLPDNFYCLFIMRDFGFDVPEYYEALETLKTPKVNPFNRLVLPREMYDELGNAYRYLPVLSDSIQLASSKELAEERRVPASGIKLDRTEAVIKREESIKLTASVLPDTATYKVVNWESSDETIAVVSQDGLVTALKEGEADITATTVIGEHSAGCHVTVAAQGITGVRLNRSSLTLKRGDVSTLTAAVEPSYAENKSVIWSSSDESVASVDENGTITALKIGKTNITATTAEGGLTATCRLTVKAPAVSGIVIDMKKTTVKEGGTLRLTATVEPEDAANQTIYWSSNNKSVATVDKTGLVTAVKEGSAIIMATSAEGNFTASCTIIVQKNKEFIDVADPSEWYYESVYWAVRNGVTSGMGEGTFRPTAQLSRAQTVAFLYNLAGKPDVSGLDVKDFSDVPQNAWYSKAVRWAVANKITSGYGTGTFRPDATCTRAMIVTFLANYAKAFEFYKEPSASSNFKDVASDDWYKKSVDWAVENGITSGYGQGTFQPNKICTRAMMVVFLKKTDALSKAA
jgi:surface protein